MAITAHKALRTTLQGRHGDIRVRRRVFLSNRLSEEVKELRDWTGGGIEMSNFTDAAWDLSLQTLETDEFNPLADYLKVVCDVEVIGKWERYPLGLYRIDEASEAYFGNYATWELNGSSPEFLLDYTPDSMFTVAQGTGVLAEVRRILTSIHGWPAASINFPPADEDRALTGTMTFDPMDTNSTNTWLGICNALLGARSFRPLRTDNTGKWYTQRLVRTGYRAPAVDYGVEATGEWERMLEGNPSHKWEDERFANRIVVISEDTNQKNTIAAVVENRNPDSPGSIPALNGRIIPKEVRSQHISSQEDAQRLGEAELDKATSYYRTLTINTLLDPERTLFEVYRIGLFPQGTDISPVQPGGYTRPGEGNWNVTKWTFGLNREIEPMQHEISRVSDVDEAA